MRKRWREHDVIFEVQQVEQTLFSRTTMTCISWGCHDNLGRSAPLQRGTCLPCSETSSRDTSAKQEWMRRNSSMGRESSEWGALRRCNVRAFTTRWHRAEQMSGSGLVFCGLSEFCDFCGSFLELREFARLKLASQNQMRSIRIHPDIRFWI